MQRVVVLGGGVAGLCTARALRAAHPGVAVTVLEASARFGGWLHSERVDGMLFERGCRGMRPSGSGAAALALVEELGLAPLALPSASSAALRYILHGGRLLAVPTGLASALRSPLTRGAPGWALRDLLAPARVPAAAAVGGGGEEEDESVAAFVERHFGAHVARVLLDAALGGIYAGDIDQLSARSVLGALWRAEAAGRWAGGARASVLLGLLRAQLAASPQQHALPPSLPLPEPSPFVRAMSGAASVSFTDGLGALVAALERALAGDAGVQLLRGHTAVRLRRDGSGSGATEVHCQSASGQPVTLTAQALVFALPAPALASVLQASAASLAGAGEAAAASAAGAAAAGVPMASVGVVGLGWRHGAGQGARALAQAPAAGASSASASAVSPYPALPHRGFGYLVPEITRRAEAAEAARTGAGSDAGEARASAPPLLGMTWDSEVFPGQEAAWAAQCAAGRAVGRDAPCSTLETRVSVMLGGARHCESSGEWGEEALLRAARSAARHRAVRLGTGAPPAVASVALARRAIPQYTVGHSARVAAVEGGLARAFGGAGRVAVVGNSWRGVGAADTIAGALEAGARLGRALGGGAERERAARGVV